MSEADEPEASEAPALWSRVGPWLWLPFVAAAPGWTSYIARHPDPGPLLRDNLGLDARAAALHMLAGALATALLWAWLARRLARGARGQGRELPRARAWLEAVLATRALLVGPIALVLAHDPGPHSGTARLVPVLIGALLVAVSVARWPQWWPRLRARSWRMPGAACLPMITVVLGAGLAAGLMLRLALWRHHAFLTHAFDLGIYDNLAWNTSHGDFLACTMIKGGHHSSAHFDPILGLIAPIYRLAPRAETLIVIQTLWVFSAAIPAYLIARRRLDDRLAATILGLGLALYPSIHGIVMFEFHSLALLGAPALWLIWSLDEDRPLPYWIALALALSVREDAALFVAGVGVYALLATPHRRRGLATITIALAYLALVKLALMPDADLLMRDSELNYTYANRYRGLVPEGGGANDALSTLLTNPGFVLAHLLETGKALSALALLVPLGLLPLAGGRRLLLAAYGATFMFLASHPNIYHPLFHYATALYPALFAAAPEGLARVQALLGRWRTPEQARALVLSYFGASLVLASLTLGGLVANEPFHAAQRGVPRSFGPAERQRYAWFLEHTAAIPATASVTASNRTAPHLSNRAELYIMQQRVESEWLVVYMGDLSREDRTWLRRLGRRRYEEVARGGGQGKGDFVILRRQSSG